MWAGWIGYADWVHGNDNTKEIGNQFHRWLNSKDGYLKEETVEIIGEGRQFVDAAAMVRWMMGALEQMQRDHDYSDDADLTLAELLNDIDTLVDEMKGAEIKTYPSRPTHGRKRGPRFSSLGRRPTK